MIMMMLSNPIRFHARAVKGNMKIKPIDSAFSEEVVECTSSRGGECTFFCKHKTADATPYTQSCCGGKQTAFLHFHTMFQIAHGRSRGGECTSYGSRPDPRQASHAYFTPVNLLEAQLLHYQPHILDVYYRQPIGKKTREPQGRPTTLAGPGSPFRYMMKHDLPMT